MRLGSWYDPPFNWLENATESLTDFILSDKEGEYSVNDGDEDSITIVKEGNKVTLMGKEFELTDYTDADDVFEFLKYVLKF